MRFKWRATAGWLIFAAGLASLLVMMHNSIDIMEGKLRAEDACAKNPNCDLARLQYSQKYEWDDEIYWAFGGLASMTIGIFGGLYVGFGGKEWRKHG